MAGTPKASDFIVVSSPAAGDTFELVYTASNRLYEQKGEGRPRVDSDKFAPRDLALGYNPDTKDVCLTAMFG